MSTIKQDCDKIRANSDHYNALLELGLPIFNSSLVQLVKLERKAHTAAENYCNIPNYNYDKVHDRIMKQVKELFGELPQGFFINADPRGYSLKIHSEYRPEGLQRDWGEYGILAPID